MWHIKKTQKKKKIVLTMFHWLHQINNVQESTQKPFVWAFGPKHFHFNSASIFILIEGVKLSLSILELACVIHFETTFLLDWCMKVIRALRKNPLTWTEPTLNSPIEKLIWAFAFLFLVKPRYKLDYPLFGYFLKWYWTHSRAWCWLGCF